MNTNELNRLRRAAQLSEQASEIMAGLGFFGIATHLEFCALDARLLLPDEVARERSDLNPRPPRASGNHKPQAPVQVQRTTRQAGVYRGGC
jgi:hypothetical protein